MCSLWVKRLIQKVLFFSSIIYKQMFYDIFG